MTQLWNNGLLKILAGILFLRILHGISASLMGFEHILELPWLTMTTSPGQYLQQFLRLWSRPSETLCKTCKVSPIARAPGVRKARHHANRQRAPTPGNRWVNWKQLICNFFWCLIAWQTPEKAGFCGKKRNAELSREALTLATSATTFPPAIAFAHNQHQVKALSHFFCFCCFLPNTNIALQCSWRHWYLRYRLVVRECNGTSECCCVTRATASWESSAFLFFSQIPLSQGFAKQWDTRRSYKSIVFSRLTCCLELEHVVGSRDVVPSELRGLWRSDWLARFAERFWWSAPQPRKLL